MIDLDRWFEQAGASRWGLTPQRFRAALDASVAHAFTGRSPSPADLHTYLASLHLADLALAVACVDGSSAAWEHFVTEFRPVLYRAAQAIDPAGGARDLADSLYGELFGLEERQGRRRSLLEYFHGRSKLSTWLRAVLAQRHIDRVRASRRVEPLDEIESPPIAAAAPVASVDRPRFLALMRDALAAAIATLEPRDRLRLSAYYQQDLTLAQIGRLLREHEATVSRQLTRTRRAVREAVERRLRDRGLDDRTIGECFVSVADDPGSLDVAQVLGGLTGGKNSVMDRSKG